MLTPAAGDGAPLSAHLPFDPCRWEPGAATFSVRVRLPSNATPGTYQLALWLLDADTALAPHPRYAVYFANEALWDEASGYNGLGTVGIDPDAGGNAEWWARGLKVMP